MKRLTKWLWLLNKRLYKKAAFLILLAMIPLLVLLLGIVSQQESGFVRVALSADRSDSTAAEILDKLNGSSALITFTEAASAGEAQRMVQTGEADAAWIFPADLTEEIRAFAAVNGSREPVITVIEREQTVSLRLSHEKLTSAVYQACSHALYLDFIRTNLPQLDGLTEQELMTYYDGFATDDKLFAFEAADAVSNDGVQMGYLLAPVRGLLSIVVLLCGLAAALFYLQDEERGTFSWVPYAKKPYTAFACQLIAVVNLSVVMLAALYVSGIGTVFWRELAALLLYAVSCSLFCMLLGKLVGSIKGLCALLPLLAVVMIAVCPVFFDLKALAPFQFIFPPTYYIRSVYNNAYLLWSAVYILGMTVLYMILHHLRGNRG